MSKIQMTQMKNIRPHLRKISEMFIEADIDLNGMIDFDEYCKVMKENMG